MTSSSYPRAATSRRQPTTPAQRVILLLGVPIVVAVVAWSGYGIVAVTAHGSYTAAAVAALSGGHLTLNEGEVSGGADVTVQGGAATGSVRVAGTVGYDLTVPNTKPSLTATQGPAGTSVGFACPPDNCQVETTASVPAATGVSVTTNGDGNTSISSVNGPVSASTNSGDLTLNADTGDLAVTTDGGDVQGTALAAQAASINTGTAYTNGPSDNGGSVNLMLTAVPGDLQISSGGGNVTVELPPNSKGYHLQLDGGCGPGDPGSQSAVPSSAGSSSGSSNWCSDVSSSVPNNPSSPNVIVISSGGGQITIT